MYCYHVIGVASYVHSYVLHSQELTGCACAGPFRVCCVQEPAVLTCAAGGGALPGACCACMRSRRRSTSRACLCLHAQPVADHYSLDGVLTLVDAAHVMRHLDEAKPEGVVNEALAQVAYADRIILNKTDLVRARCAGLPLRKRPCTSSDARRLQLPVREELAWVMHLGIPGTWEVPVEGLLVSTACSLRQEHWAQ